MCVLNVLVFIGQSPLQLEVVDDIQSPRSGVFKVLRTSSEPDIRELPSPSSAKIHGRPRDSGPDGASDPGLVTGKERELTPLLGQRLTGTTKDYFVNRPLAGSHFTPERDSEHLPNQKTEFTGAKDLPREIEANNVSSPVPKRAAVIALDKEENAASVERERRMNSVIHAPSERAQKQKPLTSFKRNALSPAFSVKSYESDQYTELPTVIHVSRRESSGSKDSNSSIPTRRPGDKNTSISPINAPMSDMRSRPTAENRVTKLMSRDKRVTSSPSLPSKPRVDIRTKRAQKP